MIARLIFALVLICLLGFIGCGYTFQGSGSVLPADIQKIYIPLVENNTPEAGLDRIVTEALQDQFERYGTFYVVNSMNEADAVLTMKIVGVNRNNRATSSGTDAALQVQTNLTLAGELRQISGPLLWSNSRITATAAYGAVSGAVVTSSPDFAGGSLGANNLSNLSSREVSRSQEKDTMDNLAEQAARIVYQQAVLPEF